MSYSLERLHDPDAYLVTLHEDFDPKTEMRPYYEELSAALDDEPTPIMTIVNLLETKYTFRSLLETTSQLQKMDINPTQHPKSKQFILVSTNAMLQASVGGFRKLGIVKDAQVASSLDDAIQIVRSNQADNSPS